MRLFFCVYVILVGNQIAHLHCQKRRFNDEQNDPNEALSKFPKRRNDKPELKYVKSSKYDSREVAEHNKLYKVPKKRVNEEESESIPKIDGYKVTVKEKYKKQRDETQFQKKTRTSNKFDKPNDVEAKRINDRKTIKRPKEDTIAQQPSREFYKIQIRKMEEAHISVNQRPKRTQQENWHDEDNKRDDLKPNESEEKKPVRRMASDFYSKKQSKNFENHEGESNQKATKRNSEATYTKTQKREENIKRESEYYSKLKNQNTYAKTKTKVDHSEEEGEVNKKPKGDAYVKPKFQLQRDSSIGDKRAEEAKSGSAEGSKRKSAMGPTSESAEDPKLRTVEELKLRNTQEPKLKSVEEPNLKSVEEPKVRSTQEPKLRNVVEPKLRSAQEPKLKSLEEPKLRSAQESKLKSAEELKLNKRESTLAKKQPKLYKSEDKSEDSAEDRKITKRKVEAPYTKVRSQMQERIFKGTKKVAEPKLMMQKPVEVYVKKGSKLGDDSDKGESVERQKTKKRKLEVAPTKVENPRGDKREEQFKPKKTYSKKDVKPYKLGDSSEEKESLENQKKSKQKVANLKTKYQRQEDNPKFTKNVANKQPKIVQEDDSKEQENEQKADKAKHPKLQEKGDNLENHESDIGPKPNKRNMKMPQNKLEKQYDLEEQQSEEESSFKPKTPDASKRDNDSKLIRGTFTKSDNSDTENTEQLKPKKRKLQKPEDASEEENSETLKLNKQKFRKHSDDESVEQPRRTPHKQQSIFGESEDKQKLGRRPQETKKSIKRFQEDDTSGEDDDSAEVSKQKFLKQGDGAEEDAKRRKHHIIEEEESKPLKRRGFLKREGGDDSADEPKTNERKPKDTLDNQRGELNTGKHEDISADDESEEEAKPKKYQEQNLSQDSDETIEDKRTAAYTAATRKQSKPQDDSKKLDETRNSNKPFDDAEIQQTPSKRMDTTMQDDIDEEKSTEDQVCMQGSKKFDKNCLLEANLTMNISEEDTSEEDIKAEPRKFKYSTKFAHEKKSTKNADKEVARIHGRALNGKNKNRWRSRSEESEESSEEDHMIHKRLHLLADDDED